MTVLRGALSKWCRGEAWLVLFLVGWCLGCNSGPISSEVSPGGTILLPLDSENAFAEMMRTFGYGGTADMTAAGRFDDQRGQVRAELLDPRCPLSPKGDQPACALSVRMLSRISPDPASPAAIENRIDYEWAGGRAPIYWPATQLVALIDVPIWDQNGSPFPYGPDEAGESEHEIRFLRAFRDPVSLASDLENANIFTGKAWKLSVVEGRGKRFPSPFLADEVTLTALVPHPRLRIARGPASYPLWPGIHGVLHFPYDAVEILDVFEDGVKGNSSLILWEAKEEAGQGRLTFDYVSPLNDLDTGRRGVHIEYINVVFRLKNSSAKEVAQPVSVEDFAMDFDATRFYGYDGSLRPPILGARGYPRANSGLRIEDIL